MLYAFLASVALAVLAAITAILFDDLNVSGPVLLSSVDFAVCSLAGLIGAVLWKRRATRRLVVTGVSLGVAAGLVWLALIWLDHANVLGWRNEGRIARVGGTLTTLGVAGMVHALALWPAAKSTPAQLARVGSRLFGWLSAGILCFMIIADEWMDEGGKAFAVFLVASAGCTVALFILDRLASADMVEHGDSAMGARVPVALTCPRCAGAVEVRTNTDGACPSCGLRLRVECEEPRCDCGYLLHGLTGEVCPECGKPIKTSQGWTATAPSAEQSGSDDPDQTPPT